MMQRCSKVSLAVLLLSLLAACGGPQQGAIDDGKAVCPPGQVWDGAQCSEERGIVMPQRSGGEGMQAPEGGSQPAQ